MIKNEKKYKLVGLAVSGFNCLFCALFIWLVAYLAVINIV